MAEFHRIPSLSVSHLLVFNLNFDSFYLWQEFHRILSLSVGPFLTFTYGVISQDSALSVGHLLVFNFDFDRFYIWQEFHRILSLNVGPFLTFTYGGISQDSALSISHLLVFNLVFNHVFFWQEFSQDSQPEHWSPNFLYPMAHTQTIQESVDLAWVTQITRFSITWDKSTKYFYMAPTEACKN